MIRDKYPDREANCINYLNKRNWTALDVIRVNMILFSNKQGRKEILLGQRHRAYDQESIKQILNENTRIAMAFDVDADTLLKEMVENKFFYPF